MSMKLFHNINKYCSAYLRMLKKVIFLPVNVRSAQVNDFQSSLLHCENSGRVGVLLFVEIHLRKVVENIKMQLETGYCLRECMNTEGENWPQKKVKAFEWYYLTQAWVNTIVA